MVTGAKRRMLEMVERIRRPKGSDVINERNGPMIIIRHDKIALKSKILERYRGSGYLSAILPPHQYPILKLARMTPIRLVQTKMDVPRYGATKREPTSSKTITIAPEIKVIISRRYFIIFVRPVGVEPTTIRLRGDCSTS